MLASAHYGDNRDNSLSFYGSPAFHGNFNCYYNGRPLFQSQLVPDSLKQDLCSNIAQLPRLLASYKLLANGHGAQIMDQVIGEDVVRSLWLTGRISHFIVFVLESMHTPEYNTQKLREEFDHQRRFVETLHELCHEQAVGSQVLVDCKSDSNALLKEAATSLKYHGSLDEMALFGEAEIQGLLAPYRTYITKILETFSLMLLIGTTADSGFRDSRAVIDLRLKTVTQLQIRAQSEPPEDFGVLDASIEKLRYREAHQPGQTFGIAQLRNSLGFTDDKVVVDIRKYDMNMVLAMEDNDVGEMEVLRKGLRQLCWFLHGTNEKHMRTLECIGFIDEPQHKQNIILYRLPSRFSGLPDGHIMTLWDFISTAGRSADGKHQLSKPALGDRFRLANMLASTVMHIHSSGWVHKNISAHSIIMLSQPEDSKRHVPYLVRWGIARRNEDSSSLEADWDLESNIYRHPQRYGKPERKFLSEHDIYSLGVVLLEIGLWQTVSELFSKPISNASKRKELPLKQDVNRHLLKLTEEEVVPRKRGSQSERGSKSEKIHYSLGSEMGEKYSNIVKKCLDGTFDVPEQNEVRVEQTLNFRRGVVEPLELGLAL